MSVHEPRILDFHHLHNAVASSAAAFRLIVKLEAVSPKVFPPTYEGGKYATEDRIIGGQKLPCVLLDSVPSQANRMELALQDAWMGGEIKMPVVSTDFSAVKNPGVPKVTSLQAPHRIVDAILRDSTLGNGKQPTKFRDSEIGKELDQLSAGYATPLLKYAPHCLVFGMWDSTGPRGGLGVKFARAMVSEVIGVNAVGGIATSVVGTKTCTEFKKHV
ncbi:MAG: type I-G CRISPR-associated RAMP protein Csb1/Cas7g [Gemmataceae bacterium]